MNLIKKSPQMVVSIIFISAILNRLKTYTNLCQQEYFDSKIKLKNTRNMTSILAVKYGLYHLRNVCLKQKL